MHALTQSFLENWKRKYGPTIMAKGEAKGKAEGKADSLLKLARYRFGRIPKSRKDQILAASLDDLILWEERMFEVSTLAAVFNGDDSGGAATNGDARSMPRRGRSTG